MTRTRSIPHWLLIAAAPACLTFHSAAQESSTGQQFGKLCAACHGAGGSGTDRGPAFVDNRGLRSRPENELRDLIRNGTSRGMPPFALPETELQSLARFIRSLDPPDDQGKQAGDAGAGERFFFGKGQCGSCHMVKGRGTANGPDLSNIARQLKSSDLSQSLDDPSARIATGWSVVNAKLRDGRTLRGFARSQGMHDLQLQTFDGRLHLLIDTEYREVSREKASLMPPLAAAPAERRDLLAYLGGLNGVGVGPFSSAPAISREAIEQVLHPKTGEWPTYYGSMSGNRHSALDQINARNVSRLQLQWTHSLPYFLLQTTPLMIDGVMYVTGPNQVIALDARTGREIWSYARPRTPAGTIAGDAATGANPRAPALGDRIFCITDNPPRICPRPLH